MSDHSFQLVAAGLYLIPALIWASTAHGTWFYLRNRHPRSQLFRLLPIITGVAASYYGLSTIWVLLPAEVHRLPSTARALVQALSGGAVVASAALFRHMLRFVSVRDNPPERRWLAINYGLAAAVALVVALPDFIHAPGSDQLALHSKILFVLYLFAMSGLCTWQVARIAQGSGWGPGGVVTVRRPDVLIAACGVLAAGGCFLVLIATGRVWQPSIWTVLFEVLVGVTVAVPIIMRMLGEVIQRSVVALMMMAAIGAVLSLHAATVSIAGDDFRLLIDFAAVVVLLYLLVPGHARLHATVEHFMFRRSRLRGAKLQKFLHTLPVEAGVLDCCRRTLAEMTRVMQLLGAAIVLRDGQAAVEGSFALEPLREIWLRGTTTVALPMHGLGTEEIRELPLPLREALIEAKIGLGVFPIVSPRGPWGHLFIRTGRLGATFTEEDAQALENFAAQLALLLDAAELLQRTISVERSLAHAEKLAAIGELTARIVHEIRNPVTAARSLAQQLVRAADAGSNREPVGLILSELERVEHHVGALLRFARREEFHFEAVDLGTLVRTTLEHFRTRLEAAGIGTNVELADRVVARADAEKLRQVLVNLIENAIDAMSDTPGRKRLTLSVAGTNGTATVQVSDSGPGVPPDAHAHLFEPFFSLKKHGTGLGLAIAKRTVDAHGGRIEAIVTDGDGMTFRIDLPLTTLSG